MQDVEQMLEAQNAYRRKRGEREITEDEFREGVVRDEVRRDCRERRLTRNRWCAGRCRCASARTSLALLRKELVEHRA